MAAIAVGRAQATLTMPLWRRVAVGLPVAAAGCVAGWLLARWLLDVLGPRLWFWIEFPIVFSLLPTMVARTLVRWIEQANLPMAGGASRR